MSAKQLKKTRVLREAVQALWIEPLEQRRLLTSCNYTGGSNEVFQIFGNNSVNNNISISYNSGAQTLTVSDSAASTTKCTNKDVSLVTSFEFYGGATTG